MSSIIILEGARTMGKSTLARALREKISNTTLLNPTGFINESPEKVFKHYYEPLIDSVVHTCSTIKDAVYIWDRSFLTEAVFGRMYKGADPDELYEWSMQSLNKLISSGAKLHLVHLTTRTREVIESRLSRDKVPYGEKDTADTINAQIEMYNMLFVSLLHDLDFKHVHTINVDDFETTETFVERVFRDIGFIQLTFTVE